MRASDIEPDATVEGAIPLVGVAAGRSTVRTIFFLEFYMKDRQLLESDFPLPSVAFGLWDLPLAGVEADIPDPIASPSLGWLWWEAVNWEPQTWEITADGHRIPQTQWIARANNGNWVDTHAQRRFDNGARWWLKWNSADPDFPLVKPRITFSQFNLLPA